MSSVKNYLSLVKFSHTVFAMPFALIGFFLATNAPAISFRSTVVAHSSKLSSTEIFQNQEFWKKLLLVVLCMITARSAAMGFNRWLDKSFDKRNPRTAIREIPAGIISANNALIFVIVNCILFVILTGYINRLCFLLSPIALFVVLFYSYTKRFTPLCHLVLGLGLSLAPIGAFLAVAGYFEIVPVLFSLVVLCWVSGFDIIYALQDIDFDKSENLYSIPVVLGKTKALKVSELLHFFAAILVIVAGYISSFGLFYWTGVLVFCGMLVYQHALVKPNDLRRVNLAFMTANGIASVVFATLVIIDLVLR